MKIKNKIIRACTVPLSLGFIDGMIPEIQKRFQVGVLSSSGDQWKVLEKYGDSIYRYKIEMERHISPFKDLKSLVKTIKLFKKEKPEVVHSMTPKAGLICMIAGKIAKVPVRIHTFTGLVFPTSTGLKKKVLMASDWLTCACSTHIIPEGEGVKKDLLNNNITKKDIKVLGNGSCKGIDLVYFNPDNPEILAETKEIRSQFIDSSFVFISIGRLVGDKGINELVVAFNRLNKEYPNIKLILVGPEESELDPLAPSTLNTIEANANIITPGLQTDIRPWLAVADCAVLASYREGFPNVVLEAGAMGLPQIVTDINGANEIIEDGVNGLIVSPKDEEALYKAMKRIIEEKSLCEEMKSKAREIVASRYDKHFVTQKLLEFYDEIIKTL